MDQPGDANNKYFNAAIKERTHRKQITELTTLNRTRLTQQQVIRDNIHDFHKSLMGSIAPSLPAVNREIMSIGLANNKQ